MRLPFHHGGITAGVGIEPTLHFCTDCLANSSLHHLGIPPCSIYFLYGDWLSDIVISFDAKILIQEV